MRRAKQLAAVLVLLIAGCGDDDSTVHGYVEGEYLRIGLPAAGRVVSLEVERGSQVQPGQALFSLDSVAEEASLAEASARLKQARHLRDDLLTGKRAQEIRAIEARIDQTEASLRLSLSQLRRQQDLAGSSAAVEARMDEARAAVERDKGRLAELEAELDLARQSARSAAVAAAEAAVDAARAAEASAEWRLSERAAKAPVPAVVEDVFFRPGEEVQPGQPVVSLLPPENVFFRFYLSPSQVARVAKGVMVKVDCYGCKDGLEASVSFIASEASFAPPVLYSREGKEKLVFLTEARPRTTMTSLRPGQPAAITLPKASP